MRFSSPPSVCRRSRDCGSRVAGAIVVIGEDLIDVIEGKHGSTLPYIYSKAMLTSTATTLLPCEICRCGIEVTDRKVILENHSVVLRVNICAAYA